MRKASRCIVPTVLFATLSLWPSGEAWAQSTAHEPVSCENEKDCLARLRGIATRSGAVLRLQLDNGKTKVIVSNEAACQRDDAEKCASRTLLGYWPARRFFVVKSWGYDDGTYDLISRRSGSVTSLWAVPELSPSATRVAAVGETMTSGAFVEIWSLEGDAAKRDFSYNTTTDREQWSFVGWDGDDRVRLRATMTVGGSPLSYDTEAIRTPLGWQLRRPWRD